MPSTGHLTVPCFSVVLEAKHEASRGPLKGTVPADKSSSRVQDGDEVAGRNRREKSFPNAGSSICLPGKLMIFHKKETE